MEYIYDGLNRLTGAYDTKSGKSWEYGYVYSESGINYYGLCGNIFSWTSIEFTGTSITVFYNLD